MDAYIESALQGVGWLWSARWDYVLLGLVAATSLLFLKDGWLMRSCAVAILFAAAAALYFGFEGVAPAVAVLAANAVLILVAMLSCRKRIVHVEARLEALTSAMQDLEIAEDRRQTFAARNPAQPTPGHLDGGSNLGEGLRFLRFDDRGVRP